VKDLINRAQYLYYSQLLRPRRYRNLFRLIRERRCGRIVEIGVWNGRTARRMITTAKLAHPASEIQYYGFDLWEQLTESLFASELSKRPPAKQEVERLLSSTGARIELVQGNTRDTLPRSVERIGSADLVFIDGGHSEETVRSDWMHAKQLLRVDSVAIFDDYYVDAPGHIAGKGCQRLIDGLDRTAFDVRLLEPIDSFRHSWGQLHTRMVAVSPRAE
jgi:predicted O-methyltransferase YrrM